MKLNELLSRYLSRRKTRRNRRQKSATQPSAVTLVDAQLEPRVLLSGTSEPEAAPADSAISIRSTEVGNAALISVASDTSFTIIAGDLYAAAANVVDATDTWNLVVVETDAASLSSGAPLDNQVLQPTAGRTVLTSGFTSADLLDFVSLAGGDQQTVPADSDTVLQYDGGRLKVISADDNTRLSISTASPDIANQVGQTKISPIEKARKQSSDARSPDHFGSTADDTPTSIAASPELSNAVEDTAPATAGDSPGQPADLFFAEAFNDPFWSIDADEINHTPGSDIERRSVDDTRTSESAEFQQKTFDTDQQTQTRDSLRQQSSTSHRSSVAQTSVFTTSDSKTALTELLNSFVQFDTSDLLEEDQELADWLSEQLGITSVEDDANDLDASSVTTTFADTNEVASNAEQNERLEQSFLKIDYLSNPDVPVTILSDQPPVPPEIVGIWQQIRFDCNPRGPPVSDRATGFGSSSFPAAAAQLQQLRYSIAPRGPSVASVN